MDGGGLIHVSPAASTPPPLPPQGPGGVTLSDKIGRRAKLLPATAVHSWKLASPAFKLLLLITITVSFLLALSELKVRDLSRLHYRSELPLGAMMRRTQKCTAESPCHVQMVADLDTRSLIEGEKPKYKSKLIHGRFYMDAKNVPQFSWGNEMAPLDIIGRLSEEGRGMELSELVDWRNQILSFDDRSGIVYELIVGTTDGKNPTSLKNFLSHTENIKEAEYQITPVPKFILTEEQDSPKGMKVEWACEKDNSLYVGSFGKEYTTRDGSKITGESNFWIVRISDVGRGTEIERINWKSQYERLREITGTTYPGYLIHEAVNWSEHKKRWFFLPRRVSSEPYDEKKDESRGSNLIISIDAEFKKYDLIKVKFEDAAEHSGRGFSSFKFVPGTQDELIMAIRSEEDDAAGVQRTYLSVFNADTGDVLFPETEVSTDFKFEGLEVW